MMNSLFKLVCDRLCAPINIIGAQLGLKKIHINLMELGAACASGCAYAAGWIYVGWVLLIVQGFLDYYDGGTRRTGFRDMHDYRLLGWDTHILADKASEVAIFTGLAAGGLVPAWVAAAALVTSIAVTAYGQHLKRRGFTGLKHSIFDRAARIIAVVVLGLLVNYTIALAIVCGMNGIIFTQRLIESGRVKA